MADGVILVAGEALVDVVFGADDALSGHPGGGPFNAARTIARLESPAAYLGRISSDRFGTRLREQLVADGVDTGTVVATSDPTTLALAEIDPAGGATYHFYAAGTSAPGLTADAAFAVLPQQVDMIHAGTLGLVFEPTAAALEAVIASLAGSALVLVDLNCRPVAISDPVTYRARISRLLGSCDVIKASDEDLAWFDASQPPLATAHALLAQGPAVVLLTRGPQGAIIVTGRDDLAVPAPAAQVVDTIGAGDAFGGAFLAWWHRRGLTAADLERDDLLREAATFACLVAARTCERAGAVPPRLAELEPVGR
jgi:fructokinase